MEKVFSQWNPQQIVRGGHFHTIAGEQRISLNTNIHNKLSYVGAVPDSFWTLGQYKKPRGKFTLKLIVP